MESLNNVTISKAYKGKSGVSKFGPWQAWSIYLVDCEAKFDYFEKGGIVPCDGMVVNTFEYEIKQNGEYTNYNIKKLVPRDMPVSTRSADGALPVPGHIPAQQVVSIGSGAEESKRLLMCTSYVKDIMVELLKKETSKVDMNSLGVLIDEVAKGGLRLVEKLTVLPPEKREAEKAEKAKKEVPLPVSPTVPAEPSGVAVPAKPVVSTPAPVTPDDVPF